MGACRDGGDPPYPSAQPAPVVGAAPTPPGAGTNGPPSQIVPGHYSAPMSVRAAASFAQGATTNTNLSTTRGQGGGSKAGVLVLVAVAMLALGGGLVWAFVVRPGAKPASAKGPDAPALSVSPPAVTAPPVAPPPAAAPTTSATASPTAEAPKPSAEPEPTPTAGPSVHPHGGHAPVAPVRAAPQAPVAPLAPQPPPRILWITCEMKKNTSSTTFLAAILACAALAAPRAAAAQTPNPAAVQLFEEGRKLLGEQKYAEACPKLAESQRLSPGVGTLLNLGKCYEALGKTASAWTSYKEAVFLGKKLNDDRVPLAEQNAAAIEPRLMRLQITMQGGDVAGLAVRRDDQDVGKGGFGTPIPVDPGDHIIEATAPGYSVWSTHAVTNRDGQTFTVTIPALVPKPADDTAAAASPLRPVAYAVGGVGVAGLIVGGVFGGLASSAASKVKNECPKNICSSAQQGDLSSANTKALVSTIGLSVGGAALATGVVLFVVSRSSAKKDEAAPPRSAELVPSLGPQGGGLSLVGRF